MAYKTQSNVTMAKPNPFLKKQDAQSLNYWIKIHNNTAQTETHDAKDITLVEFGEKSMTLTLPKGTCAAGHALMIEIHPLFLLETLKTPEKPKAPDKANATAKTKTPSKLPDQINITAKVESVQPGPEGKIIIQVEFYQWLQEHWNAFMQAFSERQSHVDRLLKRLKD